MPHILTFCLLFVYKSKRIPIRKKNFADREPALSHVLFEPVAHAQQRTRMHLSWISICRYLFNMLFRIWQNDKAVISIEFYSFLNGERIRRSVSFITFGFVFCIQSQIYSIIFRAIDSRLNMPSYVKCPYDSSHQISVSRMPNHMLRCERNYRGPPLQNCPFNAMHRVPAGTLAEHFKTCDAYYATKREKIEKEGMRT